MHSAELLHTSAKPAVVLPDRNAATDPPLPGPGELLLVTGASGAGKTTLLGAMARAARRQGIDVRVCPATANGRQRVLERFPGAGASGVLGHLARFGLADAELLLRRPRQLSDGQRQRLAIATTLWPLRPPPGRPMMPGAAGRTCRLVLLDGFAESLDLVTALAVATALQRCVRTWGVRGRWGAAVATWRGELAAALMPDRWLRADFGDVKDVLRRSGYADGDAPATRKRRQRP
ncbi:MAG: AAA family ATPase [Tepidisphaerales bacterium]